MTGAGDGAAGLLDESQPENRTRTTTVTARTDTRASGNMASRMLPPRHHGEDPAFALRATADPHDSFESQDLSRPFSGERTEAIPLPSRSSSFALCLRSQKRTDKE